MLRVRLTRTAARPQVAAGGCYPAEFLADGSVAHQQLAERVVEVVPPRDPAGLVEQPDGRAVIKPGTLGPGQRPQGQRRRLGLAGPPGLGNKLLGGRAVPLGVGRDVVIRLPRTYQKIALGLCSSQAAIPPQTRTERTMSAHG